MSSSGTGSSASELAQEAGFPDWSDLPSLIFNLLIMLILSKYTEHLHILSSSGSNYSNCKSNLLTTSTSVNPLLHINIVPTTCLFAGGSMPQLNLAAPRMQSQFVNQNGLPLGDHLSYTNNLLQRRLPHQNRLMPTQLMPQQHSHQPRVQHQFQQSFGQLSGLQPQPRNSRESA